ncbi:MAG: hypothetical protein EZS28_028700 [Streblomastix strix]|uniref:Uncharacterized protein n=1 Tax=Streblomastix strix TaxID=222440 RepID=A0A5J4V044_9EUKA|nr:MAG: hypothetical protein EZS28_028700 [Streblomastix strix]
MHSKKYELSSISNLLSGSLTQAYSPPPDSDNVQPVNKFELVIVKEDELLMLAQNPPPFILLHVLNATQFTSTVPLSFIIKYPAHPYRQVHVHDSFEIINVNPVRSDSQIAPQSAATLVVNVTQLISTVAFDYDSVYTAPPNPLQLQQVSIVDQSYIIILMSISFIKAYIPPPFPVEALQSSNKLEFVIIKDADFYISTKIAPPDVLLHWLNVIQFKSTMPLSFAIKQAPPPYSLLIHISI